MALSVNRLKTICEQFSKLCGKKNILMTKPQNLSGVDFSKLKLAPATDTFVRSDISILNEIKTLNPKAYKYIIKEYNNGNIESQNLILVLDSVKKYTSNQEMKNLFEQFKSPLYKLINGSRRNDKLFLILNPKKQKWIKKLSKKLFTEISKNKLPSGIKLHRADDYRILDNIIIKNGKYAGKKLSKVLKDSQDLPIEKKREVILDILLYNDLKLKQPSFLSTSILKNGTRPRKPIQSKITTVGITEGLYIDSFTKSKYSKDFECLLNPITELEILDIIPKKTRQWILEVLLRQFNP